MIGLKPLNRIPSILCLCLLYTFCPAQDKAKDTWGKISPADFAAPLPPSITDSNASGIVLSDLGDIHFVGNKNGWFSYVFKRQTRVKVLRKNGFDLDKVVVRLYAPDENAEKISKVEAVTYNIENGAVVSTRLDSKDLFQERRNKYYIDAKFSLPGIKDGSIIEYTYTVTSDYEVRLPSWQFQWEKYPCLWSECKVEIPQALFYTLVRQGIHPYAIDKGSEGHSTYRVDEKAEIGVYYGSQDKSYTVSAVTVKHDWAMKDIPAFGTEPYLTTSENYVDRLSFQLSKTYNGAEFHDVADNWAHFTGLLLGKNNFGLPLQAEDDWLTQKADQITAGESDPVRKARLIHSYLADHLTCTNYGDPYISTNLADVLKKNGGSIGDINLLMIAMLRRKGLSADPVMLSTRQNGFSMSSFPDLDRMNYVIARVKLFDKVYYLDAAHPQLGFGQLPGYCYNGPARIISNTDSGAVWFLPDSLKEQKTTMVLMSASEKGFEGSWQSTFGRQESFNLRAEIAHKGQKDYFKDIQTAWGEDMVINNGAIDSLDRPEDPVKVHYDFLMKESMDAPVLYLNPMLGEGYRQNPFKAAERKYPVEMPYTMDETYIFSMDIPSGYAVEELPKSTRVAFNVDQGSFEYLVLKNGEQIQFRCRLKLNRATFQPEDYPSLRDFFGFVVKKENEQIVLKKK
jgi:hypothetical protein